MSLSDAYRFIVQVSEDDVLRRSLSRVQTVEELNAILDKDFGGISNDLFEEAFRGLHVRCQTEMQAEALKEIRLWWQLLLLNLEREQVAYQPVG
jgi:hypothetical protein